MFSPSPEMCTTKLCFVHVGLRDEQKSDCNIPSVRKALLEPLIKKTEDSILLLVDQHLPARPPMLVLNTRAKGEVISGQSTDSRVTDGSIEESCLRIYRVRNGSIQSIK